MRHFLFMSSWKVKQTDVVVNVVVVVDFSFLQTSQFMLYNHHDASTMTPSFSTEPGRIYFHGNKPWQVVILLFCHRSQIVGAVC